MPTHDGTPEVTDRQSGGAGCQQTTEVLIVGGGLGVAAALAALTARSRVVLTEEYDWLGGQLTSQAVPPDEHRWVEQFGVTAQLSRASRGDPRLLPAHYPLTERARAWRELNPGAGSVSRLCHEPRVAVAVIEAMLAPYRSSRRLQILQPAGRSRRDRRRPVTLGDRA